MFTIFKVESFVGTRVTPPAPTTNQIIVRREQRNMLLKNMRKIC